MPVIELRVSEPYERDIGKCRVRIPKKYFQILGIKSGDAVTITGKEKLRLLLILFSKNPKKA